MAGIYDVDADRAHEVGHTLELEVHSGLDSLLDAANGLVVAVPTVEHEAVAVAALGRGVDVLVEKPLASSLEAADRILEAAESSGAMIQVGHVERFNSAIRAAEPFLQAPLFIESHRLAPFVQRSTDVAVVLDLMIHDVDLVQKPRRQAYQGCRRYGDSGSDPRHRHRQRAARVRGRGGGEPHRQPGIDGADAKASASSRSPDISASTSPTERASSSS